MRSATRGILYTATQPTPHPIRTFFRRPVSPPPPPPISHNRQEGAGWPIVSTLHGRPWCNPSFSPRIAPWPPHALWNSPSLLGLGFGFRDCYLPQPVEENTRVCEALARLPTSLPYHLSYWDGTYKGAGTTPPRKTFTSHLSHT
jgi:hypothetical protein